MGAGHSQTSTLSGISAGSFTYDANDRLSTDIHDNNGNTLASGSSSFAYNFENRLKSMNGSAVTLQYDGDGNRVAKTASGVTTRYLVDDLSPTGYAQVTEEIVSGTVQRVYTYGNERISQKQLVSGTWTPRFYGYDGFGTVRLLADSTGTVTDTYDYDAWGNAVNMTGATPNNYLYRGEQYDPDLQLYYLRARYFNPLTGRFLSRDTYPGSLTQPVTQHKYLYANVDPVNRNDPSGMLAPNPTQAPPKTVGRSASEYTLVLTAVALPFAAIFVDTVTPAAYDIQCIWQREGAWMAVAYTVSLGIYVPSAHADPGSCRVVEEDDREPEARVIVKRGVNANNPGNLRFDPGLSTYEVLNQAYPCVLDFVVKYKPPKVPGVIGQLESVSNDDGSVSMNISGPAVFSPPGDPRVGFNHWDILSFSPDLKAPGELRRFCPNSRF